MEDRIGRTAPQQRCTDVQQKDGHTEAEQMAEQAAAEAGWRIRWPRIRMMSQSPDLAGKAGGQAEGVQEQPTEGLPVQSQEQQPATTTATTGTTWARLRRFLGEVTEVFGQPAETGTLHAEAPLVLDGVGEANEIGGGGRRVRGFLGNTANVGRKTEAGCSGRPQHAAVEFVQRYPLAALVVGWAVLAAGDWVVTNAVVPRLVARATQKPWIANVEAGVLQTSLDSGWAGWLVDAVQQRVAGGEEWLDGALWRLQLLVGDVLLALTRAYAVHWLCFAIVTARLLLRGTRVSMRLALAYALYFSVVDSVLWQAANIAGGGQTGGARQAEALDPTRPDGSWQTRGQEHVTLVAERAGDTNMQPPAPETVGGTVQLAPHLVRSPYADAVAEALERRRAAEGRHAQRTWQLREWRRQKIPPQETAAQPLAMAATAAVWMAAAYRMRGAVRAAPQLCFVLALADVLARGSAGKRLALNGALFAQTGGRLGSVLPAHVLSTFGLLALREAAFAAHSMRVWYTTTVRDRRTGAAMLGATPSARRIRLAAVLDSAASDSSGKSSNDSGEACANTKVDDAQPRTMTLSRVTSRVGAPFAHRVCFLCLSGFCERCLLSMQIWPTATPVTATTEDSAAAGVAEADKPFDVTSGSSAAPPDSNQEKQHSRRRSRTQNHSKRPPVAANVQAESLAGLGLLNPVPPATTVQSATRRPKSAVDVWIASSVAHCPCRGIHGPGPSSFVARAAKLEHVYAEGGAPAGNVAPLGTLVPLAQYAHGLQRLGLVHAVDAAAAVFAEQDAAAAVLPLLFGRLTAPADPHAVAAADALLASSAASYAHLTLPRLQSGHTPAAAPFLGSHDSNQPPARIVARPTPLRLARAAPDSFRLCAESVEPQLGVVRVLVVMTPALAHVLLSLPRTATTTAVCVPASLAAAIASPAAADDGNALAAATSRVADADPFLDYVRVQLGRGDVVVRVNGARWADADIGPQLSQPITVRGLQPNRVHRVTISICSLRSYELVVVLPSSHAAVSQARVAKQQGLIDAAEQLEAVRRRHAAAAQTLKRTRREMPRQIHHWRAERDALARAVEKQTLAVPRFQRRLEQLDESAAALKTELLLLRAQLPQTVAVPDEDDLGCHVGTSDTCLLLSRSSTPGNADTPSRNLPIAAQGTSGFNVLTTLSDFGSGESAKDDDDDNIDRSLYSSKQTSTGANAFTPLVSRDNLNASKALAQAAQDLENTEGQARAARDAFEEAAQDLKAQRSHYMAELSKVSRRVAPLEVSIAAVRRDIADAARRMSLGSASAAKLRSQVDDLQVQIKDIELLGGSGSQLRNGADDPQNELIRSVAALRESIKTEQSQISALSAESSNPTFDSQ
ncbi:hypothetical protein COEREDRAFT_89970 [Coemansia reversa NRRL 1564]|uniref:Uncharacterized protein n=1 Tax=Coemansia reversa (strain ATCC 12441 / NRRL 1564) TaxID=763665 RepID=A0A2G5B1L8_COERN|nr:hypothetical protein COEREDRAFT_89970 [Coemansia reversa NRRL 1564]|eukprot:PIA12909.1 hypothetical protein COEREDRAFT_89970 [Coemansia reversa NRRL 1564]